MTKAELITYLQARTDVPDDAPVVVLWDDEEYAPIEQDLDPDPQLYLAGTGPRLECVEPYARLVFNHGKNPMYN